jgi:hypothetical protein
MGGNYAQVGLIVRISEFYDRVYSLTKFPKHGESYLARTFSQDIIGRLSGDAIRGRWGAPGVSGLAAYPPYIRGVHHENHASDGIKFVCSVRLVGFCHGAVRPSAFQANTHSAGQRNSFDTSPRD